MHTKSVIQRPSNHIEDRGTDSEVVVFTETNRYGATDAVLRELAEYFFLYNMSEGLFSDEVPSDVFQRDESVL